MRNEILKAIVLAFAALILVCGLSGCTRKDQNANDHEEALARTTITALVWAPDWPEEMHQIAAEFTRANPKIEVDVQFMIGNSVEENIKPKIASNKLPDFMSVNPNAYSAELADQGILADLGRSAAWDNMQDSLKADWTTQKGKHYGISGGVAATLMYYNKDMF